MSRYIDYDAIDYKHYQLHDKSEEFLNGVIYMAQRIEEAPSIDVDRPSGEWIRTFDGNEWFWYCSNCKTQWYEDDLWMGGNEFPHFCPNCGAKMKGADDESD